jgi:hypothetical protein
MGLMDVNFNNLRIQAMISYDKLCSKLNAAINEDGDIDIPAKEIQKDMDELRQHVGIIACVFDKTDENFKMVRDEVFMAEFNPNADNECY